MLVLWEDDKSKSYEPEKGTVGMGVIGVCGGRMKKGERTISNTLLMCAIQNKINQ